LQLLVSSGRDEAESSTPDEYVPPPDGQNRRVSTFYEEIGEETIRAIVHDFYAGVATDPLLRPMYAEEDLGPAEERFALFLMQYWGGPSTYSQERGHPRLRMRHAPFEVNAASAERWLFHFRTGLDRAALTPEQDAQFWEYVTHAAQFMINTPG
jgi:hemoglobin